MKKSISARRYGCLKLKNLGFPMISQQIRYVNYIGNLSEITTFLTSTACISELRWNIYPNKFLAWLCGEPRKSSFKEIGPLSAKLSTFQFIYPPWRPISNIHPQLYMRIFSLSKNYAYFGMQFFRYAETFWNFDEWNSVLPWKTIVLLENHTEMMYKC